MTQELIDWDAAMIAEDRDILESTDPDAIVDMGRKIEKHMPSDRRGMLMRKRLLDLLHEHDEEEVPKPVAMDRQCAGARSSGCVVKCA